MGHYAFVTIETLLPFKIHVLHRLGRRRVKIPICSLSILLKEEKLSVEVGVVAVLNNFVASH